MFGNLKQMGQWLAIAVAVGLVGSPAALAAKPPRPAEPAYTVVAFLTTPPAEFQSVRSWVWDLNERGNAVGFEEFWKQLDDDSYETVEWGLHRDNTTGACTALHDCRSATGINNLNQIVGNRNTAFTAAFWRAFTDVDPVDLPLLSGFTGSEAQAINDDGFVVGRLAKIDGQIVSTHGVVWRVVCDEAGNVSVAGPVLLPLPEGDTCTWPLGLSELSELSGGSSWFYVTGNSASVLGGAQEAVVWTVEVNGDGLFTPGEAVRLVEDHAQSCGLGVNVDGDVCGSLGSYEMPFLAAAGQTAQLLPVPPDTHWGEACDINNSGKIVGVLDIYPYKTKGWINTPGNFYAYVWKDGAPTDLTAQIDPTTGWTRLRWATVINDAGMIGGSGNLDVQWRGFVLTPIEP